MNLSLDVKLDQPRL